MLQGYDQDREDDLLNESGWEQDGYRLFDLSSWAGSSRSGWFGSASESNCLAVTREHFEQLGGLDEEFGSAGGGLVNLDYYKRACETDAALPIVLLGEGTFHQFHDGVATNVPRERHPFAAFEAEYVRLRGRPYVPPASSALLLGHAPDQALPWLLDSAATALRRLDP